MPAEALLIHEMRRAIEQAYGWRITTWEAGPRQAVAQTYILNGSCFAKLVDKREWIPQIVRSLPTLVEMRRLGIRRIGCPIPTIGGELHLLTGGVLVVVFELIEAAQSYDYSTFALGDLLGGIHSVKASGLRDTFEFPRRDEFDAYVAGATGELRAVLDRYDDQIRFHRSNFDRVVPLCRRSAGPLVITHGDAPGNVLVRAPDDLYLIDWDEILLGAAERDLWMLDHDPEFLAGYQYARPDFVADPVRRSFSIHHYYFRSMLYYFDEHARTGRVGDIETGLLTGWMPAKLATADLPQ